MILSASQELDKNINIKLLKGYVKAHREDKAVSQNDERVELLDMHFVTCFRLLPVSLSLPLCSVDSLNKNFWSRAAAPVHLH